MVYFWFRRDLRLNDNTGLNAALRSDKKVQPIFIFDADILSELPKDDSRVDFFHNALLKINDELKEYKCSLRIEHGKPIEIWKKILEEGEIKELFYNSDYEPYASARDTEVENLLQSKGIKSSAFKDHVYFEKGEILKGDGTPYVVYTPYKNKWLEKFKKEGINAPRDEKEHFSNFAESKFDFPTLSNIGFEKSPIQAPDYELKYVKNYGEHRDYPAHEHTTQIGHHLRFGTVSVRAVAAYGSKKNDVFLSEIIWRDFFAQILWHFPKVITANFREKYNGIKWRNNKEEFDKWCKGETGYPIVDAGMRQLNKTGFMHNRVRMITASFLIKDLLIDWKWGEAYFAQKLLDYDLASNNGNWQWAAGTGCDAAPYFRIFNPTSQQEKFDKGLEYVKKWVPEFGTDSYTEQIVNHKEARLRTLEAYKTAIEKATK